MAFGAYHCNTSTLAQHTESSVLFFKFQASFHRARRRFSERQREKVIKKDYLIK